MTNNQKRILLAGLIAAGVLTALFLLLTPTPVAIAAFCFSLIAPVALCGTLWKTSSGTKNNYILNAAFPLQMYTYAILNLTICGIFVLLDQLDIWRIGVGWFILLHLILIAFFAWRLIAMDAGQEEIEKVEKQVKITRVSWKIISADVEALKNNAPAEYHRDLQNIIDAINYADPMSCDEVAALEEAIKDNVIQLELKLRAPQAEEITAICLKIQRQIKDRNTRLKMLK